MRNRLLTLATVGAAVFFGAVATAGATPGSSYQWQQPGCAPVTTPCTQPQVSSSPAPLTGLRYTSSSDYRWAQPGTAPVYTPDAQPS
jgi:hypothetical protein